MEPAALKRPKPGDGEEELFRMQEEFLKSNDKPAAKVINLRPKAELHNRTKPTDRQQSTFAKRRRKGQVDGITTSQSGGDVINPQVSEVKTHGDFEDVTPPSNPLLGNIVERKFDGPPKTDTENRGLSDTSRTGFPEVFAASNSVRITTIRYSYLNAFFIQFC